MDRETTTRTLPLELPDVRSVAELAQLLGAPTPEEQAFMDRLDLSAPPTPEEMRALRPDFVERLVRRMVRGSKTREQSEERLPLELPDVQSVAELAQLLGAPTPEEQAFMDRLDLSAPPTPEEMRALRPDFVERLVDKTIARIKTRRSTVTADEVFNSGLVLLSLVRVLVATRQLEGRPTPQLSDKAVELAEELVEDWHEQRESVLV